MTILKIDVDFKYGLAAPTDILLQLEVASTPHQNILSSSTRVNGNLPEYRLPAESSIGERMWVNADETISVYYSATVEILRKGFDIATLDQSQFHDLGAEATSYLMASRYCPCDEFHSFVSSEFGDQKGGRLIKSICRWMDEKFQYSSGSSNAQTTAADTFIKREGVCRDFAHVLITLARAGGIPARMVSAFGLNVSPQDFHAVVEVFLQNQWRLVDPTNMSAPHELAIIGVGRDAADISFMTSFGPATLINQTVRVGTIA